MRKGGEYDFYLNTVKEHLRITHHLEDVLLMAYMAAAQDWAESFLGKPLADFETLPGTVLAGLLLHTALCMNRGKVSLWRRTCRQSGCCIIHTGR
ncbi:MAG: head-tail connector protein [Peptococcaceae bacterium MAG4]|nr:head-tail connector protein [Peptococcaceae bacterium MAG4]